MGAMVPWRNGGNERGGGEKHEHLLYPISIKEVLPSVSNCISAHGPIPTFRPARALTNQEISATGGRDRHHAACRAIVTRKTQRLAPLSSTTRYKQFPSAYRPGSLGPRNCALLLFPVRAPGYVSPVPQLISSVRRFLSYHNLYF